MKTRAIWFSLGLLSLSAATGCGRSHYRVSGRVTYNGSPVKQEGHITFVGADGSKAAAVIDIEGNYLATGVTAGKNLVAVSYLKAKDAPTQPGDTASPKNPYLTPRKYASPSASQISVTVAKDAEFNIPLTGPPLP